MRHSVVSHSVVPKCSRHGLDVRVKSKSTKLFAAGVSQDVPPRAMPQPATHQPPPSNSCVLSNIGISAPPLVQILTYIHSLCVREGGVAL